MNREELAHVLRAAADITGEKEFVIIGSQAALAHLRALPGRMGDSQEIDIYPKFRPDLSEMIEGSLGKDSAFERTFHYYADGVSPDTASLPQDWESRSVRFNAGEIVAVAPDIDDLAVSKLLAGREKDLAWLDTGIATGLLSPDKIGSRIRSVPKQSEDRYRLAERSLDDRRGMVPDPTADALRLDPALTAQARQGMMVQLDDVTLLRRLSATGQARLSASSPAAEMELIEGYKTLRREAGRRQLLFPEDTPTPSRPMAKKSIAGSFGPEI